MERKFKVGDYVQYMTKFGSDDGLVIGEIVGYEEDKLDLMYEIKLTHKRLSRKGYYNRSEYEIEKVTEDRAMLWLLENS